MQKVTQQQIDILINDGISVILDESGRKLSTFCSGGFVNYVVLPQTINQLARTVSVLEGFKYHLLGAGSNTLISDNGVNCVVTTRALKGFEINEQTLTANAGEIVHTLALKTAEYGLAGMEFLACIPGTVGGAIAMNAGAFGFEIKDILLSATLFKNGQITTVSPQDLCMAYRYCKLNGAVVLAATFKLKKGDPVAIKKQINDNVQYRQATQPHEPSLGSVFKRINGKSPAYYIQGCGLKGARIGFATVSGEHCNFIVNSQGATSRDYLRLMDLVRERVYEKYKVTLEAEIKFIKD